MALNDYLARRRRHARRSAIASGIIAFSIVAVPLTGVGLHIGTWENSKSTQVCTVEQKDRTTKKDGGSDQRLYTDCGVFTVADDVLQGQWNSADTFAQLEEGETYELESVGWRNGFFSTFPNVISATPVN
jgi:hypothetical protein